jgi:hypothetical protein
MTKLLRPEGMKIKRARTDGGVEYLKEFLAHPGAEGLIKEKAIPYTKHHPGKAERTHQTIFRNGRANLKQSEFPPEFYNDSQRYAAYIFNRTVHGKDTIIHYEHFFKTTAESFYVAAIWKSQLCFYPIPENSQVGRQCDSMPLTRVW